MRSKRIISLMLALCMVLSLIPTVTFAAPENGKEYRTAFEYEFNSQAYNSSSMIYVAAKENPAISRSLDDIVSGDQWKVWSIWANSAQLQPSPEGIDFNNTLSNKDGSTAIVIDLNITKPGTYIPSLVYSGKPSAFIADVYLTKKTGDDDSAAWKGINLNGNSAARVPFRTRVSAIPADEKLGTVDMFETEEKKGKKTKEFGEFTINDGEEGEYLLIIRANGVNENHIPMVPNGRTDKYVECELYSFILEEEVPELTPGTSTFTYNTSFDVLSENLRVASSYTGISTSWQSFPGLRNAYGAGLYNKRIMGYNSTVTLDKDGNTVEPFNVFVQENTDDWEYAMDYNSGTFALTKEHDGIYMNFTTGDTAGNFTSGRYMMLRLNVPERGKYTLWMEGNNKAGYAAPAVYFFPDDGTEIDYDRVNNKGANIAHQQCYAWFRDLAPIGYMDLSDTSAEGYVNIGTALVPEPGVYYLVLFLDKKSLVKSPATASTQSIALSGIKLAPFKEGDDADELLTLSLSTNETQLESGETQTLVSTADYSRTGLAILGADALEYKSTDEDVIKVSAEGIVTAESEGTAVVKAAVKGNEAIYDEITFTVLPEDYGNEGVVLEYITSWNALQADKLPITTKELDGESGYSSLYSSGTYTRDGSIIMNRKLMNRSATSTLNANRETVDEWRLMDFDITEPWDAAFCLSAGGLRINKPTDNMYLNFETVDYGKTDAYTTYLALRLKVPHRGTYRLGIDSNGTSTGVVPAIHFFRDDGTYLSDADILAKVKAGNAKVGYHDFTETTGKYKLVAEVEAPRQGEYFIVFHGDSTALEKNPNASGDGQYQQMNLNGIRLACIPGAVSEIKLEVEGLRDKNDAMPRLTEKTLSYTMFDKNGVPLDDLDPAKLESVVYKSSDESVATVSDGVITAHKNGETEISVTVKYDGEEATGTYNLTVADAGRNLMEHLNPGFDTEEWVWTVPRQDEEPETPKFMRTFIVTEKNGNRAMGVKFDGSVAAKSNPAGIFLKYDGHRVPVKPGRLYQLTFKFKADYEIPENASEMQLIFDMYAYSNPTGTTSSSIPFNTARSTDISKQANFRELYDDWCEVIIPVVAPTEYDGEYLYLTPRLIFRPIEADLDKAGYDGMAYFDDFCLREVGYEGVTVETIGDTTKGGGSVIVNAKPYSTLGTPISLGGNWKNADASFATSDEHVIGGFKSIAFGNAGNSDGINYMTAKASLNGLNGSATVSSTIKINGIERTGSVNVTASGFAKKLLYATA
ncbi:MAG: Ig-like domain-containing protein, partial [Oscillospiraceae bacterium]|nr:Ig-like domain-containing protein [Oscillospiraceae bacterium]